MRGNGLARGHTADRIDAMKVFVSALDEGRLSGPARRLRRSPTATAKRNKNKEVLMVKSSLYAAIGVPGPIIATSGQQPHAATADFLGLDMRLVLQQIQIRQLWKQQLRKQRQNLHECR